MNNIEFVGRLKNIIVNYNTSYAKGTFGQKATDTFINQKKAQYPTWYTTARTNYLKSLSDDTRLFDCVGLIKAVLWNFPNTVYTSNGVPDLSDSGLYNVCKNRSKDFSNIEIGELVHISGHVGIFIGDNKVIECTNAWDSKVIITSMVECKGYQTRKWQDHGKLPYIDYVNNTFNVKVETDWLEVHNTYSIKEVYKNRPTLNIVDTKENYGKLDTGGWIDLTKCRRI